MITSQTRIHDATRWALEGLRWIFHLIEIISPALAAIASLVALLTAWQIIREYRNRPRQSLELHTHESGLVRNDIKTNKVDVSNLGPAPINNLSIIPASDGVKIPEVQDQRLKNGTMYPGESPASFNIEIKYPISSDPIYIVTYSVEGEPAHKQHIQPSLATTYGKWEGINYANKTIPKRLSLPGRKNVLKFKKSKMTNMINSSSAAKTISSHRRATTIKITPHS